MDMSGRRPHQPCLTTTERTTYQTLCEGYALPPPIQPRGNWVLDSLFITRYHVQRSDTTAPPAPDQPAPVCPACQRGQMCWVQTLRLQPELFARWMQPPGRDTS